MSILNEFINIVYTQSLFLENPFIVGFGLIIISFFGLIFSRKNIILLFMNLEIMLLGCGLNFLGLFLLTNTMFSYAFCFFILAFAAAEAAIGLGLIVNLFAVNKSLSLDKLSQIH